MPLPLDRLPAGQTAILTALGTGDGLRRRLLDLGFLPGAALSCLFTAPGGDPRAYGIRGTVVALRNSDAAKILTAATVSPSDSEKNGQRRA